jgi:hypothetical protein
MVLFILFPGFGVTKYTWEKDVVNYKIIKIDFLKKLKKIGDVYTYTPNIYNIASYYNCLKITKIKKLRENLVINHMKYHWVILTLTNNVNLFMKKLKNIRESLYQLDILLVDYLLYIFLIYIHQDVVK